MQKNITMLLFVAVATIVLMSRETVANEASSVEGDFYDPLMAFKRARFLGKRARYFGKRSVDENDFFMRMVDCLGKLLHIILI